MRIGDLVKTKSGDVGTIVSITRPVTASLDNEGKLRMQREKRQSVEVRFNDGSTLVGKMSDFRRVDRGFPWWIVRLVLALGSGVGVYYLIDWTIHRP